MTTRSSHWFPCLAIVGAVLVCHGLLLVNDGTYWDDWLLFSQLKEGNWETQHAWNSEMGLPILAYFFWSFKVTGLLGCHLVVAFVLILGTALLTYLIGLRSGWLRRSEALGLALLSATFPANQTTVLLSTMQYLLFYAAFHLAVLLLLETARLDLPAGRRAVLGGLSLLFFFLSFSLNSLLVVFFPVLGLLFIHLKNARTLSWAGLARAVLSWRLSFVLAPFVYWGAKKILFPVHGAYQNYNRIHLDLDSLRRGFVTFGEVAIQGYTKDAITGLAHHPLIWGVVVAGAFGWYGASQGRAGAEKVEAGELAREFRKTKWLVLLGVSLLVAGMFPYVAVNAMPARTGWDTRHAILTALPMAILLLAGLRLLWLNRFSFYSKWSVGRVCGLLAGSSLVAAFGLATVSHYVAWQARAAKDRAIVAELEASDQARGFSIYWIDDRYPLGGERHYSFYEWTSMFRKAWGGQTRIGLAADDPAALGRLAPYYNARYNAGEVDPNGPQLHLEISPGSLKLSEAQVAFRYLYYRFLKPEGLPAFLRGIIEIRAGKQPDDLRSLTKPPASGLSSSGRMGRGSGQRQS